MRNVLVFQFAQNQLQLRHFLLVRLADDDGGIDRRQHAAHVLDELDGTGAIDESVVVTHEVVVANVASTLILWWRASLLASPTVVPASTVPWRWIAPVRARIASRSVVLPLWNGPTSAMHRGPELLVPLGPEPFCPINASLAGREVGPGFPAL